MISLINNLFQYARRTALGIKVKRAVPQNPLLSPFYKIFVQRLVDYRHPRTFNLEPTNACNLKCPMCPRDQSKREVGYLDMGLARKIIDEGKDYGPRNFVLHKDGEPLLHPEIVEIVRYIKKADPQNTAYISTNGLLLTEEMGKEFIEIGLDQLHISIGAAKDKTYSKVRGASLVKVEENVKRFLEVKRQKRVGKPVVTLQIIKMEETINEIDLFIKKWRPYNVEFSVPDFLTWGGVEDNPILHTQRTAQHRYPCHSLWLAPSINWDGTVSVCCIDWNADEIIGDLTRQTLTEVWQGEKIKRYRQYHLTGEYHKILLCEQCNYWRETPNFWFFWQYKTRSDE